MTVIAAIRGKMVKREMEEKVNLLIIIKELKRLFQEDEAASFFWIYFLTI